MPFVLPTNCRLLKDAILPSDNAIPDSYEEAKWLLKRLGVKYIYHTCTNNFILYRGEYVAEKVSIAIHFSLLTLLEWITSCISEILSIIWHFWTNPLGF